MQVKNIVIINNLAISYDLGYGKRISEKAFITNNKKRIKGLLPERFSSLVGEYFMDVLHNATAIIYSIETIDDDDYEDYFARSEYEIPTVAVFFTRFLWITKDHACDLMLAFNVLGRGLRMSTLNSCAHSTSACKQTVTTLNKKELEGSCERFLLLTKSRSSLGNSEVTQFGKTSSSRLSRAFAHVMAACTSRDVGFKIASYVSALEALFAKDKGELSHQLSERVAFFLAETGHERLRIFTQVKDLYKIRSQYVHGAAIKSKAGGFGHLITQSQIADNMLRNIFQWCLEAPDKTEELFASDEKLDGFFLSKIFSSDAEQN